MPNKLAKSNPAVTTKNIIAGELKELNPTTSESAIDKAIDIFFNEISIALMCGDRVEFRGFGSWSIRTRTPKQARNPKTNQTVSVGAKNTLYFRASKELIKLLNNTSE